MCQVWVLNYCFAMYLIKVGSVEAETGGGIVVYQAHRAELNHILPPRLLHSSVVIVEYCKANLCMQSYSTVAA